MYRNSTTMEQPPKPRPIHLPLQVLSYFGEWLTQYENGVRNITLQISKTAPSKTHSAPSPKGAK